MQAIIAAVEIKARVKEAKEAEADLVALENDHHKQLKDAVENPSSPYHPHVAPNLLPFMLAITEATGNAPAREDGGRAAAILALLRAAEPAASAEPATPAEPAEPATPAAPAKPASPA